MSVVESFACPETSAEPIEATEEAVAIINKLGLWGQSRTVVKDENGIVRRSPFREIFQDEVFVYKTLCPQEYPIKQYDKSPIPLRVLEIADLAVKVIPNCELRVWDRAEAEVKDPVLVAVLPSSTGGTTFLTPGRQQNWMPKTYILARWGAELETFGVLLKQVIAGHRERLAAMTDSEIIKMQSGA